MYQDKPMLATSLKGRLALVYPNTLMLAPYFPHSPRNTLTFINIYIKFYEEKIEKKRVEKKSEVERKIIKSEEILEK